MELEKDIHKKVNNFRKALNNLRQVRGKQPPYDPITEAGMVSLFEICFEQAWKMMKDRLEYHGYSERKLGSPSAVIKLAYQVGMVDDEVIWREALRARNDVVHSYSDEVALQIIKLTQEKFLAMFEQLQKNVEKDWL